MRHALAVTMLLVGGVVAWGCGNKPGDEAKPAATGAQTAAATGTGTATAASTATATAAEAPVKAPPLPAGRSAAPTLDEWSTMKKEVTVKGSSALKCETKIVREYLRVSCRGKVDPEGTPTGIKILKGGREAMVYAHAGVTSLILPYVEGTDFEAAFSWTQKSHKLAVKWPKGNKLPVVVGVFEGAASPLDGTARGDNEKLCACHKKVTGSPTCDDLMGAADADCDRSFGSNCQMLLACSRGEPGAMPRCLPGFHNGGATGRCYKSCGAGNPCPGKLSCVDGVCEET
jgi:hypothetical protein